MSDPSLRPSASIWWDLAVSVMCLGFGVYGMIEAHAVVAFVGGLSGAGGLAVALADWRRELDATARRMGWIP